MNGCGKERILESDGRGDLRILYRQVYWEKILVSLVRLIIVSLFVMRVPVGDDHTHEPVDNIRLYF
jgi:hypothetical protein|tara:strand:- start:381 stop:578 length:198 start_codon:yes stop_codon:yes gene_type:complete